MSVKLCPPKWNTEVLIPRTWKCGLIWKLFLYGCNQVKMKTSGWALIQYDWYPQKKRRRATDTQGKHHVMKKAEIGSYAATNWKTPRIVGNDQKQGEKHGTDSLSETPRRNQPCLHLDCRLLAYLELWEWISVVFLCHLICDTLL